MPTLNYFQYFLAGFLLADIYLVEWLGRPRARTRYSWDLVWMACWLPVAALAMHRFLPAQPFILPFALLLASVAAFKGRVVNRVVTTPWVFTIGGMCYSIYLIHAGFLMLLSGPLRGFHFGGFFTSWGVLFVTLIPVTVLASALFFLAVERPCMDRDWPQKPVRAVHFFDEEVDSGLRTLGIAPVENPLNPHSSSIVRATSVPPMRVSSENMTKTVGHGCRRKPVSSRCAR